MAKTKPLDPKPTIEDPHVFRAILAHLGLPAEIPYPDPPQPPPGTPPACSCDPGAPGSPLRPTVLAGGPTRAAYPRAQRGRPRLKGDLP